MGEKCKYCLNFYKDGIWYNVNTFLKTLNSEKYEKDLNENNNQDDDNDQNDTMNNSEDRGNNRLNMEKDMELDLQNRFDEINE
ncbi:17041_t:CDS:1, partial [Gigaspora margarita]